MSTFPWLGERPLLNEYPSQQVSDSRELEAIWEISEDRLYLLGVSGYRFDGFAPRRLIGLRDLMPDRIHNGKVFADWFSGEFSVMEPERVDPRLTLRPEDAPTVRVTIRKMRIDHGRILETAISLPSTDSGISKP